MRKRWIALGLAVIVLGAVYWFASGGLPGREPAEWLTAQPIAHRGQWAPGPERPENSLAAFAAAAEAGNAVELDVQMTSDGSVVVFHDDELDRMTDASGLVSRTPLVKIKSFMLKGGSESAPTLEEALRTIGGRVPVFVEIKNRGEIGPLEDAVARALEDYDGDAAVMSFNPYSLARMVESAPNIPRGQLSSALRGEDLAFYEVFLLRNMLMNWKSKPDFIAYDIEELPMLGTSMQRWRGRPLLGWTAKDAASRDAAERLSDAAICDPGALTR